jgi:hypothetical protein
MELLYNSAILLLGVYPKEHKSVYNRDTYTSMFIAILFTTAKQWNQSRCTSTDEWIKTMLYIYTVKYTIQP